MRGLLVAQLRHHWPEQLLGALAIALVVAAFVAERAVTASADAAVHDLAHTLGKNMLVLPAGLDAAAFHRQQYGPEAMRDDAPARIAASPLAQHVRMMQPRLHGRVATAAGDLVLVGEAGRWPPARTPGAVPAWMGGAAARRLGLAPGAVLGLEGMALELAGVADPAPDGLDDAVFVPLAAAQSLLGRSGQINALRLGGCWCRIDVAELASQVERLLPGTRAFTVAGVIKAQQGAVATMKRYSLWLEAAALLLVSLVVVGLVTSQARRRAREIGLLAAIGVRPSSVALLLAAQAGVMGALGGLGGWLGAVPLTRLLSERLLGAAAPPSPVLLAPAVLVTGLACALVALLPATRAAAADPTVVLREASR
jgi:hypothetical protein